MHSSHGDRVGRCPPPVPIPAVECCGERWGGPWRCVAPTGVRAPIYRGLYVRHLVDRNAVTEVQHRGRTYWPRECQRTGWRTQCAALAPGTVSAMPVAVHRSNAWPRVPSAGPVATRARRTVVRCFWTCRCTPGFPSSFRPRQRVGYRRGPSNTAACQLSRSAFKFW